MYVYVYIYIHTHIYIYIHSIIELKILSSSSMKKISRPCFSKSLMISESNNEHMFIYNYELMHVCVFVRACVCMYTYIYVYACI